MKIQYSIILLLIAFLILSGCAQQQTKYVCPDGTTVSDASFCPKQEVQEDMPQKDYQRFEIKMYIQHSSPGYGYWDDLPNFPSRNYDDYQLGWYPQDEKYYDGGWLHLYTFYDQETITCYVKEFYNGVQNDQFTMVLYNQGDGISGDSMKIGYETDKVPMTVRYDVECTGDESGNKAIDTYRVSVTAP